MPEGEGFLKGYNDDKSLVFRIQTIWEDEYFKLHVFQSTNAWFALVTKDLIADLADQHELEKKIYLESLKRYFTNETDSLITFDIIKNNFVMYKKIETANFRVKYFFVALEKLDYQGAIESYIDDSEAKRKDLLKQVALTLKQISSLQNELETTQRKNDEFIDMKVKADLKMYSSFTLILNEKKQRIQYLTELLTQRKDNTENKFKVQSKLVSTKVKKSGTSKLTNESLASTSKHLISDSDLSEEYDTDEEKKLKVKTSIENTDVATTSTNLDFLGGSSPPPSLPKRAKIHTETNTIGSILENQKNEIIDTADSIDINVEIESKKNEMKENAGSIKSNDKVDEDLDYDAQPQASNTQDLLDRM